MCCDGKQALLYVIIVCSNSVYSLASLFLPSVYESKDVAGFWVGIVFAMYSIASVITSPIIGKFIDKIGYANALCFAQIIMGSAIIPIGYLMEVENSNVAVGLGILLRTMQGVASATINTTCFSLAATKYSD